MTNSLRKAKKFQTVARKRHMTFIPRDDSDTAASGVGAASAGGSAGAGGTAALPSFDENTTMVEAAALSSSSTQRQNPYSQDGQHIRETIDIVTSFVKQTLIGRGSSYRDSFDPRLDFDGALSAKLERLCVLISPQHESDSDDDVRSSDVGGNATHYDSTMAGMAANSILSQFINAKMGAGDQSSMLEHQQEQQFSQENTTGEMKNLAFLLAHALSHILHYTTTDKCVMFSNIRHSYQKVRITAAITLNQLAATEPPPPSMATSSPLEEYSPYGPPPTPASQISSIPPSWCYVIVHSPALQALVQNIDPPPNSSPPPPPQFHPHSIKAEINKFNDRVQLCEKCVWAVGNLAGDSELARMALLQEDMGIVSKLMQCVILGLSIKRDQPWHMQQPPQLQEQQQQHQQQLLLQEQDGTLETGIDLLRNSIWALINLFRGGEIAPSTLLNLDHHQQQLQTPRLSPQDVGFLLSLSDTSLDTSLTTAATTMEKGTKATWDDVANETCWLLSYLTRDDTSVMEFLCTQWNTFGTNTLSMLVERLAHSTDAVSNELLRRSGNNMNCVTRQMEYLIPCCRTLKNVALTPDLILGSRRFIESILLATTSTIRSDNFAPDNDIRPFELSLAKLISFGTLGAGNAITNIASEATSLAGTCLYDAGIEPSCATSSARIILLPALCQAILSPLSTFDFQREVVWALWSTIGLAREAMEINGDSYACAVQPVLVRDFIRIAPPEMGMARALTTILAAMDADATEASLRLINLLLRWMDYSGMNESGNKKIAIIFEEVGLVDALWRICDNDTDESEVAELAASILDDFYEHDDGEDECEMYDNSGGQFQFQMPDGSIPEGGFNFGAPTR